MKAIEEHIRSFPESTQKVLYEFRKLIKALAPEAEESMAYGMPAYKTHGKPLVYFNAFRSHIGFYATPTGHAAFEKDLSPYKQGKGSVQFPLNKPMPWELIKKIIEFRIRENDEKAKEKN